MQAFKTCLAKRFVVRRDSDGNITIPCVRNSGDRTIGALNRLGKLENVSFCSYHMKWLAVPIRQLERDSRSDVPTLTLYRQIDPVNIKL
jgi:hypothetical protein